MLAVFVSILGIAAFFFLKNLCIYQNQNDLVCLHGLESVLAPVVLNGKELIREPQTWYAVWLTTGFAAIFLFWIASILKERKVARPYTFYFLALGCGLTGEWFALNSSPYYTLAVYSVFFVIAWWAVDHGKELSDDSSGLSPLQLRSRAAPFGWLELSWFVLIMAMIIPLRFYAMNRIPGMWDGEACPHRAIASAWDLIIRQELLQTVQQSSGMSWVLTRRFFTNLTDQEMYFLDERFLGTAVSIINCIVMYFMTRWFAGPLAGFVALILLAFGPLEFDWSRKPTIHNLPVLVALLTIWCTALACAAKKWRFFILTAVLMAVSRIFYPSAKLMFLVPIAAALWILLFHRAAWAGHKKKILLVGAGAFLWIAGRSIIKSLYYGELSWISPLDVPYAPSHESYVFNVVYEFLGFIRTIYFEQYMPTHWTTPATFLPARSVSTLTVIFFSLALIRLLRSFFSISTAIVGAVFVAGLIPALGSGMGDRRVGAILVFLIPLAAIEIARYCEALKHSLRPVAVKGIATIFMLCLFGALFFEQVGTYFSQKPGRPAQLYYAETLKERLQPETLVILVGSVMQCDFYYGLHQPLVQAGGSIAITTQEPLPADTEMSITRAPKVDANDWFYLQSDFQGQAATIKQTRWKRYIYTTHWIPEVESSFAYLRTKYPQGIFEFVHYPCRDEHECKLAVFTVDLQ